MGVLKQWLPYVLSGISAGGQYALIAVGYTMVYGILRLINFAHGDIFMVAGLIMVYLSATMPLYAALPAVVILTVALGFAVERCAYKPLRQAPRMSVMISCHRRKLSAAKSCVLRHRRRSETVSGTAVDFRHHHDSRRIYQARNRHYPRSDAGAGRGARDSHQAHKGSAWPCAQPRKTLKRRS